MKTRLGVGILGAGSVTQAIHLPILATLHEQFVVRHIMDIDQALATAIAARVGARASTDIEAILNDEAVDVVAICSPPEFHAEQANAACRAGKRVVFCEKPLVTNVADAHSVASEFGKTRVPLIVGTMHAYDPACLAALDEWTRLGDTARHVRSLICLPPNHDMITFATDLAAGASTGQPAADLSSRLAQAERMFGVVMGLAIHATPLVRRLVRDELTVRFARLLPPFGYAIALANGSTSAHMTGFMPGEWQPAWTLHAWGRDAELQVQFPPSYVLAGSATARLTTHNSTRAWRYPHNGYQTEWQYVAELATGVASPRATLEDAVADTLFALEIANQASHLIRGDT
jgi:myo-inositol 2-dehydrogenase / D-chiro-inositol 1-dehydrogenase